MLTFAFVVVKFSRHLFPSWQKAQMGWKKPALNQGNLLLRGETRPGEGTLALGNPLVIFVAAGDKRRGGSVAAETVERFAATRGQKSYCGDAIRSASCNTCAV